MVSTVAQVSPKGSVRSSPEDREGEDADVDPGDNEDVIVPVRWKSDLDVIGRRRLDRR